MNIVDLGPISSLYPSLATIVGSMADGKPNFMAVAHVGIMNHGQPQYISVGINKMHHTHKAIQATGEFSVNIPGEDLMVKTDYVGLVTGRKTDKSGVFDVTFGELANAPLVRECPVCLECRVHTVIDFPEHSVFVGEIIHTRAHEDVLNEKGKIDIAKVKPLLFAMGTVAYYGLGPKLGKAWGSGKALVKKTDETAS
ncbi:flavin reductase family protein [Fundidesulfovibrio butyratiphilus]